MFQSQYMRTHTAFQPLFNGVKHFLLLFVVGNGGHEARTVGPKTAIWAAVNGTNSPGGFVYGFAAIDATPWQLTYRLVRTGGGSMTDTFTVTRP